MGIFKPARNEALEDDAETICDLDAIINKKAIVILAGESHVVEPITTGVFAEFYSKIIDFKKASSQNVDEANKAYYETVKVLLPTVKFKDVEKLTLPQKAVLIESLSAKVVGNKALFERNEKKN